MSSLSYHAYADPPSVKSYVQIDVVVWWGFLNIKNSREHRRVPTQKRRSFYTKRRGHWLIGTDKRDGEIEAGRLADV